MANECILLLSDTLKALPGVRIVLCEAFGLPVEKKKDNWESYPADLIKRQAVVAKLAEKYNLPLVHFQRALDEACKRAESDYWIWDGIHPTYSGHQILAEK